MYTIRPAQRSDLPDLPLIETAAAQRFVHSDEAWIADDEGMSFADFEHHFVHNRIWVALWQADGGHESVVGFAVARRLAESIYLHEIDVHPDHGRRGLGRRLIEVVITWARQERVPAVTLSTFRDVPWNAPYYAKLGFQALADEALAPDLRAIRTHEAEAGLDISRRLCMILPI